MDNNLNEERPDEHTSTEAEKSPSSYEDPNAGYRAESDGPDPDRYVPKDGTEEKEKQPKQEQTYYSYGENKNPNRNYGYQNGAYNSGNYQNGYYSTYNGQSPYQVPQNQIDNTPLSLGEWILTLIVGMVPCVGLIIFLIWAFSNSGNVNRRNYCRAALIVQLISFVVVFAFIMVVGIGIGVSGHYYY